MEAAHYLRKLVRPRELIWPTIAGTLTLVSSLALTVVSAWLITRSWQMPPIMEITVAVTAVRALGISRAAFRYVDRLAAHRVALTTAERSRVVLWRRFATSSGMARRGEVVSALGTDIDALADAVVRSLIPALIALLTSAIAVLFAALLAPAAALLLAAGLAAAGLAAPSLIYRRTAATAELRAEALRAHTDAVEAVLYDAPNLRIHNQLGDALDRAAAATRRIADLDRRAGVSQARASALATGASALTAIATVAVGAWLVGAFGTAAAGATHTPEWLTVLVLIPLAAFESVGALPSAAQTLGNCVKPLRTLAEGTVAGPGAADSAGGSAGGSGATGSAAGSGATGMTGMASADALDTLQLCPNLAVRDLVAGYEDTPSDLGPWSFDLPFGTVKEINAPSGSGKTTLLKTLAGLLPPIVGSVRLEVGGAAGASDDATAATSATTALPLGPNLIRFIAEDEHIFATTVCDNIAVANSEATDEMMWEVLQALGLAPWVRGLPHGLGTVLSDGDESLSGGQRRRLLLARALTSTAPILLLDEPTEHLDGAETGTRASKGTSDSAGTQSGESHILTLLRDSHHLPGALRERSIVIVRHPRPEPGAPRGHESETAKPLVRGRGRKDRREAI